jgi:hypothetical protein
MSQILPKVTPPSITDMVHFGKPQPVVLQPRVKTIFVGIFVFPSITYQSQKQTDIDLETGSGLLEMSQIVPKVIPPSITDMVHFCKPQYQSITQLTVLSKM